MRKYLFLILCSMLFLTGNVTAVEDTSRLIRRAYLDMIGMVPTIEEIDWYFVYNDKNSYEVAIKYLYNHPKNKWKNIPFDFVKIILNSEEYKKTKRDLTKSEIEDMIFYVSGFPLRNSFEHAKKLLINNALICCDTDVDRIDYICNNLMSRISTINESNILIKVLKDNDDKKEDDKWMMVLDKILTFDDVKTK